MKIFVLLGTSELKFTRLIDALELIVDLHDVYIQHGHTEIPANMYGKPFLKRNEVFNNIKESDLIISQGGVGSVLDVIKYKKPLIIFPRLQQFGELVGDQLEFSDLIASKGLAKICYHKMNLKSYIQLFEKDKPYNSISIDYENFIKNIGNIDD